MPWWLTLKSQQYNQCTSGSKPLKLKLMSSAKQHTEGNHKLRTSKQWCAQKYIPWLRQCKLNVAVPRDFRISSDFGFVYFIIISYLIIFCCNWSISRWRTSFHPADVATATESWHQTLWGQKLTLHKWSLIYGMADYIIDIAISCTTVIYGS